MNVGYEDISTRDLANMLGLDITTVSGWCKNGTIICQDVSESGSTKARYLIPDHEAEYLRSLYKKYGKFKAMRHYSSERTVEATTTIEDNTPAESQETSEDTYNRAPYKPLDEDKVLNSIIYLREVRERIEDCKAELAQLENEYRELKQEMHDTIDQL